MKLTAEEVIGMLQLEKHPAEGGYFLETYRCADTVSGAGWLDRSWSTAIYYMLDGDPACFSEMHRLPTDEVFHFYCGDPVEMLHLYPDGSGVVRVLGNDLLAGQRPQIMVPGGVWQGCRILESQKTHGFALMGTTVAPGFLFQDYQSGSRSFLSQHYPTFSTWIAALTRKA